MYDHLDNYKLNSDNLLQCTGLKDKKGTLIYEGDIVKAAFDKVPIFIGIVEWGNDYLRFEVVKSNPLLVLCHIKNE